MWARGGFNHAVPRINNTWDYFFNSADGETWPSLGFEPSLLLPYFFNNNLASVNLIAVLIERAGISGISKNLFVY